MTISPAPSVADRKPCRSAHRHRLRCPCLWRRRHIMLGGVRCRTAAAWSAIPMPTWCCMRWSMRSSARSPMATSASIFRRATCAGGALRPTSSWKFAVDRVHAARRPRRPHRRYRGLRGAASAAPRRHARAHRRDRVASPSNGSASRRPPARMGFTGRGEGIAVD